MRRSLASALCERGNEELIIRRSNLLLFQNKPLSCYNTSEFFIYKDTMLG
jgi:hypothetical protein